MRVYRLCRVQYPPFDGEGANRFGGRWNSKGKCVIYASENRSLAVLEILVHLSDVLPDKYVLASADLPEAMLIESVSEQEAPENWGTLNVAKQQATRETGDQWLRLGRSAVLAVSSVVSGERNSLLNPEHPEFARITLHDPVPFRLDVRLLKTAQSAELQKTVQH
jgi:RES domain-containing protein